MTGLTPVSFKTGRPNAPRLSEPRVPGRHNDRFWKDEEKAIVREFYPMGGAKACQVRLPHRPIRQIYAMASKLGLSAPKQPAERTRHTYPPELDERIKAAWPTLRGRGAVAALAGTLQVPRAWLTKRATKLHLTMPHKKEPTWTEAETALMRKVPLHDPDKCARIFREHGFTRSPTAIVVRATRLEISRRTHETLSGRQAARILGVDDKTITQWCIAGDIEAGRRGSNRLPQQGGDAWAIEPASLRRFVIDHIERIDIRKVEKFAFVALLTRSADVDTRSEEPASGPQKARPAVAAVAIAAIAAPAAEARSTQPAPCSTPQTTKRTKTWAWQSPRSRLAARKWGRIR